jgi:hypothetical protein
MTHRLPSSLHFARLPHPRLHEHGQQHDPRPIACRELRSDPGLLERKAGAILLGAAAGQLVGRADRVG